MLTLFKKTSITTEQIHAEFDSAQDRLLSHYEDILNKKSISNQVKNKYENLKSLGFIKSETVTQVDSIKDEIAPSEKKASLIQYFKTKYPFEKFVTVEELERICKKYNLIHAPVQYYIKDVPEKNVLEMKNCKKLEISDSHPVNEYIFRAKTFHESSAHEHLLKGKEFKLYLTKKEVNLIESNTFESDVFIANKLGLKGKISKRTGIYEEAELIKVEKSGLFIAAPKSHFDLGELSRRSEFGFFKVRVSDIKDPVVFEYCTGDICRIVTKWGTDDDQSYLDPGLLNETLN
jgi:hypothetical protein